MKFSEKYEKEIEIFIIFTAFFSILSWAFFAPDTHAADPIFYVDFNNSTTSDIIAGAPALNTNPATPTAQILTGLHTAAEIKYTDPGNLTENLYYWNTNNFDFHDASFTISAWITATSTSPGDQMIFMNLYDTTCGGDNTHLRIGYSHGAPYGDEKIIATGIGGGVVSTNSYARSVPHYAVATMSATGTIMLFVDSVYEGTFTGASTCSNSTSTQIKTYYNTTAHLNGFQDEVQIWPYAFTQTDVDYWYNSGAGREWSAAPPPPTAPVPTVNILYPTADRNLADWKNWKIQIYSNSTSTMWFQGEMDWGNTSSSFPNRDFWPTYAFSPKPGWAGLLPIEFYVRKSATLTDGETVCGRMLLSYTQDESLALGASGPWLNTSSSIICTTIDQTKPITTANITTSTDNGVLEEWNRTIPAIINDLSPTYTLLNPPGEATSTPHNASGTDLCSKYFLAATVQNVTISTSTFGHAFLQWWLDWTPIGWIVRNFWVPAIDSAGDNSSSTAAAIQAAATMSWGEKMLGWSFCLHPFATDALSSVGQSLKTIPVINIFTDLNAIVQNEVSVNGELLVQPSGTPSMLEQYDHLDLTIPFVSSTIRIISSSSWQYWASPELQEHSFKMQSIFFALAPIGLAAVLFLFL